MKTKTMRTRRSTAFVKRCLMERYVFTRYVMLFYITNGNQMVACDNTECTYQWVSSFIHFNILFC
jgi:hypothetical protein